MEGANPIRFHDARKKAYLNRDGDGRPLESPVPKSVLTRARKYRKRRLLDQLNRADCPAILLYDPINIRYASDVSNMRLWAMHNAFHYVLLFADGYLVEFTNRGGEHLSAGLRTVDEVRVGKTWFYMYGGDRQPEFLSSWAVEIVHLLRSRNATDLRLAVDKLDPPGLDALRAAGVQVTEGQKLTEHARVIKSADEIELMKWTIRVCESGMARMYENSVPDRPEREIWAELHDENIRSGGEWLETRLLTIGQRTNPWFSECSDHFGQLGDMLSFDTDMIGPYGYCADLSRAWTIGHVRMSTPQRELYASGREQIEHNLSLLKPGMSFREFNEKSWRIPEKYVPLRYGVALHGVGLADEYPFIPTHPDWAEGYDGCFAENMALCVESLIGERGGRECVKLETQVFLSERGPQRLDQFPWEAF